MLTQQQTTLDRIIEKRIDERVRRAIQELTERRDAFVQYANREVAAYNGGIQALQELLEPPPLEEPVHVAPPVMTNGVE